MSVELRNGTENRYNKLLISIAALEEKIYSSDEDVSEILYNCIFELYSDGTINSLSQLERGLRNAKIPLYLIAAPYFSNETYVTAYPHKDINVKPKYTLYLAEDKEEAEEKLLEFGITAEENMQRLKSTGIGRPRYNN